MDWRLPIEQQNPVSPSAHEPATSRHLNTESSFINSDEYRRALTDPTLIEYAIQARAYTERLRSDSRDL